MGNKNSSEQQPDPFTRLLVEETQQPYLYSIIIPLHERCLEFGYMMHAIARSLDGMAEVIIIDTTSRPLHNEFKPDLFQCRYFGKVTYHYDPSLKIATSKNKGISLRSSSRYTVFVDSDIMVSSNFFPAVNETFSNYDIDLLSVPSEFIDLDLDKTVDDYLAEYDGFDWRHDQQNPCKPEPYLQKWGQALSDDILLVPAIHGCVIAVRNELVTTDFFSPLFLMHGEHVQLGADMLDRQSKSAYIMRPGLFALHIESAGFSITRNLPDRGYAIFNTLLLILYRNINNWKCKLEDRLDTLIKEKWIPMIADTLPISPDSIVETAENYAQLLNQYSSEQLSRNELIKELDRLPLQPINNMLANQLDAIVRLKPVTPPQRLYYLVEN